MLAFLKREGNMPSAMVKYQYKRPGAGSYVTTSTGITTTVRSDDLVRAELIRRHKGLEIAIISISWR